MLKSSEEYTKDGGQHCPKCDSENIEAGNIEADTSIAFCNVVCRDCGSEWTDEFVLKGYSDLIKG